MGFRDKMMRFMMGRYGVDQLGKFLNIAVLVLFVVSIVLSFISGVASSILYLLTLVLIVYNYFRMFSRNIYKRAAENQKFLNTKAHLQQLKTHKFFRCPKCRTKVRVPRHKGKICIICPKCKEEFIEKT